MGARMTAEHYLAARVLDALLREDYGGVSSRVTRDRDGVAIVLASGRRAGLTPGSPFQDFSTAPDERLSLAEVLDTLREVADPADAEGVAAFARECRETLAALAARHRLRGEVDRRLRGRDGLIRYESLAASVDHPLYPTARCRLGVSPGDLPSYAPEFAPEFAMRWTAVPRELATLSRPEPPAWWPRPGDVGLPPGLARTHVLFPVHPLAEPLVAGLPGAVPGLSGLVPGRRPYLVVRPTLSMRTVEAGPRVHLKVPLPTSTLGLRNRRSIKPGTLLDGALAQSLLRRILLREPALRATLADEQTYGHAGHEYLGWLVRGLPEGEIVPVAALLAPLPDGDGRLVAHEVAGRHYGGDVRALLDDYLAALFAWNVTLFVRYGVALEAHQQNLALLFGDGPMRLLVKDNDGLLASPGRLRAAGLDAPEFDDARMLTDDPYALADVFVTITLHLAAMAVAHGLLPHSGAAPVRRALTAALEPYGDDPMARLLRARTLDAARLTGKSMVVAGTLVAKERTGARDVNKFYGTTGPNYLRGARSVDPTAAELTASDLAAEETALGALLRCWLREVGGPRGDVRAAGPHLTLRLAGTPVRVRARGGIALRFDGPPEYLAEGRWRPLGLPSLLTLVEDDLDGGNEEFADQVRAGRDATAAILAARERAAPPADPWLASEQALVAGHPFHPAPKARAGDGWLDHAPEAHARFAPRLLGVRADLVAQEGDTTALDGFGEAPPGYLPLPAHPWQLRLLAAELREPLADGRLVDLGPGPRTVVPTSSVRTVYDPGAGVCLKFSLDVRITNCVRKNAWYELAGAVELTRRLAPVFELLDRRFPGTRWLPEPGYRSAALGTRLLEGLSVIVRTGPWAVCGPGVTPVLAAALAAGGEGVPEAVLARRAADPVAWFEAYVERVAYPVLDAYVRHGVVLEPHVQNVLVGFDADGLPAEVVFRDLEGTKLVTGHHDLTGLPDEVAGSLSYDAGRGWDRVAYCLFVNHLAEVAATVADAATDAATDRAADAGDGRLLRDLWAAARASLERYVAGHAPDHAAGHAAGFDALAPLTRLLAGAPLPAKANLTVRWARAADREAGYVHVANPLAPPGPRLGPLWPEPTHARGRG
ncbi:IucA/IucC family protein [Microbispora sp. H10885]|uniref:IucA/IucC family protein n=1 Tax=Microbispora sp. H10885 TaxID=2729110 RepID=UPI002175DABC|nr:IucA/IucC family protein [Microbispora sp. H10885]